MSELTYSCVIIDNLKIYLSKCTLSPEVGRFPSMDLEREEPHQNASEGHLKSKSGAVGSVR